MVMTTLTTGIVMRGRTLLADEAVEADTWGTLHVDLCAVAAWAWPCVTGLVVEASSSNMTVRFDHHMQPCLGMKLCID